MQKLRVLIVDDSIVIRRLLTNVLSDDPELLVAGTAPNGKVALAKVEQVRPDVVILDVEMPVMDGLEALSQIRQRHGRLPIIMFSTRTERGAVATIEALSRGASDYVPKPSNVGSIGAAMELIRQELIPKIKALCGRGAIPRPTAAAPPVPPLPVAPPQRLEAIVAAVSTGGPNALCELVGQLPAELEVPILVVQHMPPTFTDLLAQRLDSQSPLNIREAREGESITGGQIRIAPGGRHLVVRGLVAGLQIGLTDDEPVNSCRPSGDVLFRSAAELLGRRALGLVLTGMGHDGLDGCRALKTAGARVIVQDQATSVVWGMPGAVAQAGYADEVLPLSSIGAALVRAARTGRRSPPSRDPGSTSRPLT